MQRNFTSWEERLLNLVRDSAPWIWTPLLAAAISACLNIWFLSATALILSIFMIFFHRDPDRRPEGNGMVAPADGMVVEASPERVAIFMNHHNVHVNRSPIDGKVRFVKHKDGGHAPAFHGSSHNNEQNQIVLDTPDGEVKLCQITGALVRRIVCYVKPGDLVERGERIGMIRFGSRVEFTIPVGYKLIVNKGSRVKAGETVVAVKEVSTAPSKNVEMLVSTTPPSIQD
ncbi:MAG: phosphatidylserine decarboxylase [Methanotrichaceae archaeon]